MLKILKSILWELPRKLQRWRKDWKNKQANKQKSRWSFNSFSFNREQFHASQTPCPKIRLALWTFNWTTTWRTRVKTPEPVMSHCSDMIMCEGRSSLSGSFHTDERRGDPLLLWFEMYRWVWRRQCYYGNMRWIERVRGRKKGESGPSITVLWGSLDSQCQSETQMHFSLPERARTQTQWRRCEITQPHGHVLSFSQN